MTLSAEPPDSENCDQIWECLPTTSRFVNQIAFSPDGKIIASYFGESVEFIKLWDVVSGKQLCAFNWQTFALNGEGFYSTFASNDSRLSFRARGVLAYLHNCPEDVRVEVVLQRSRDLIERQKVRQAIQELRRLH